MRTMEHMIRASMLARAFGVTMKGWLDARQLAIANERNMLAGFDSPVCHTHDFCDANMAMLEAFERLMGRRQVTEDENERAAQADLDVMSDAWRLAKRRRFWGDADEAAFVEWQATREECADLGQQTSDDSLSGVPGLVYEGGYIEYATADFLEGWAGTPPIYRLFIERCDWFGSDLEALERILFFEWVLPNGFLDDQREDEAAPR